MLFNYYNSISFFLVISGYFIKSDKSNIYFTAGKISRVCMLCILFSSKRSLIGPGQQSRIKLFKFCMEWLEIFFVRDLYELS